MGGNINQEKASHTHNTEDGEDEGLQSPEMDSKQQKQQADWHFREEGEEEWQDKGGKKEELVAHARELDFGAHCLPCQGNLVLVLSYTRTLGLFKNNILFP